MAEYEDILRQHNDVITHVERLDYLVSAQARGAAHSSIRDQLVQHLKALAECLVPHFANEEEGGYFGDVRAGRPGLNRKLDALGSEHAELLERIRRTIERAADDDMEVLQAGVASILEDLRTHEASERGLLQDAALVDIGTAD